MANNIAVNRLKKELTKLKKDPPPGIIAEPKESDILTWFYAIQGPPDTPYHEGGVYVGKLKFPAEYPMKPPGILMLTPSGRFEVNTRLCMSMSDFHPESWNPMWSVATILQGVVSFMSSDELTTGGIKAPASERKRLAGLSKAYNAKHFNQLFDGDMDAAFAEAEQARKEAEEANAAAAKSGSLAGKRGSRRRVGPRKSKPNTNDDYTKTVDEEDKKEDDEEEESENQQQPAEEAESTQELTPEEIEKRRKKNAKKRAKQKAKKAASKADNNDDDGEEDAD